MADINIENFYQHIGKILNILYAAFPTKSAIYVDDVVGIDEPDEYGLHSPDYTSGFFALIWLGDEDYLRYTDTIRQDGIDQAALTHKAFLRLTRISDPIYLTPSILSDEEDDEADAEHVEPLKGAGMDIDLSPSLIEDHKLVINQLRSALRSGDSIAITKVVQHILHSK